MGWVAWGVLGVVTGCLNLDAMAQADDFGFITTWSKAGDLAGFECRDGQVVQVAEGGNPGGFLKAVKTATIVPKPYLRNDLGKLFGAAQGTISFDLKALGSERISSAAFFLSTGTQAFRCTVAAQRILGHDQTGADGWVHYSIPWKADWTEEQAVASGWQPFSGQADHWAAVIDNPIWSQLDISLSPGAQADREIGLDNFRIEAGESLDAKRRQQVEPPPPQQRPVVHFAFDEGTGNLLHDGSGNLALAEIHGAAWVRNGGRWALEFDGVDDYVDCGEVSVLGAQTLVAWIYAEPIYSVFLGVPILGNGSCQFDQHVHDLRSGPSGFLPFRKWVHAAQAWDGKTARLYIDGTLASVSTSQEPVSRKHFLLAGPRTPAQGEPADYQRRFKGRIASLMLYNRALTADEVLDDLQTSNITKSVSPLPIAQPGLGRIKVELDATRLGRPLDNVSVTVDVCEPGGPPLLSAKATVFDPLGRAVVDVAAPSLPRGRYRVRATAYTETGEPLETPGEEPLDWSGSASFPAGPVGARKLNNLVTELLHVAGPEASDMARPFANPRAGFVYIANRGSNEITIAGDSTGGDIPLRLSDEYGGAHETMRYLPPGSYTIRTPAARDLIVRAVAQTVYDYANTLRVYVDPFGPYAGEFEQRHVYPHTNTFLVQDADIDRDVAKELKARGRRLLSHASTGLEVRPGASPVEIAVEKLGRGLGFSHPNCDGYLVDEFAGSSDAHRVWSQALARLLPQPQFKGRALHAWSYALYDLVTYDGGEPGREFVRTLQQYDCAVQWECYLDSQRSELAAWRHIHDKLVGETLAAERAFPGIVRSLIVAPYAYETAGPPWLTMTDPGYDTRTYLEMQVQTVATDPAFDGVRGLAAYRSCYADEETVRWTARLFRHYAIEGRTEPLGTDPYLLAHVRDGDFEEQGRHWQVRPAEPDSIRFTLYHQLGSIEGRYTGSQGDTVLQTRRSAKGPNGFSQEIRNLQPGRLYSFRMFSADPRDFANQSHAVRIEFDGAELVTEKCFTHVATGTRPNSFLNWHVRVFRALGTTVTLRVSDWAAADHPGGPLGQELVYNFVKIQPYWQE